RFHRIRFVTDRPPGGPMPATPRPSLAHRALPALDQAPNEFGYRFPGAGRPISGEDGEPGLGRFDPDRPGGTIRNDRRPDQRLRFRLLAAWRARRSPSTAVRSAESRTLARVRSA